MPGTNRLTVCLIKAAYEEFEAIIAENTRGFLIDDVGTIFIENSQPHPPDWVADFFGGRLDHPDIFLRSSSAKGVLLVRITHDHHNYIFAIIFGFGRHLLRDHVIEERFGLKVVLNSVDHQHLRAIDKTSLGSVPKQTREQLSREAEVADFGLDVEQDLVSSVTGRSRFDELGKTIVGRDTLSVNVKVDVTNIKAFLNACITRYLNDEYKQNFGWIDQIADVRDPLLIDQLDSKAAECIAQADFDKVWMAAPEIVDWVNVGGFRYRRPKRSPLKSDLDIQEFQAALPGQAITIDVLKESLVYLISTAADEAIEHWSAYKCMCAEVTHNGSVYVLNSGKWYAIVNDFAQEIKLSFASLPECALALPDYHHASEGAYNDHIPGVLAGSYSMDRKLITYGGGASSIEFCDILTADRLIHVKRYSGSAQLSHLFAQGTVAGELFIQDREFRKKLNSKLPRPRKLPNSALRPRAGDYEIVFAIITKSQSPLDIPFFSKVTLRNARRRLEAYGYKVSKKKIQHV